MLASPQVVWSLQISLLSILPKVEVVKMNIKAALGRGWREK